MGELLSLNNQFEYFQVDLVSGELASNDASSLPRGLDLALRHLHLLLTSPGDDDIMMNHH